MPVGVRAGRRQGVGKSFSVAGLGQTAEKAILQEIGRHLKIYGFTHSESLC